MYPRSNEVLYVHGALLTGKCSGLMGLAVWVHYVCTPQGGSQHYAIKYHWFREHIGLRNIVLVKISSEDQLGDLFTKGLSGIKFSQLQKKLMGW